MRDLTARLTEIGFENFLFLGRYEDGRIETGRYGIKNRSFVDFYTGLLRSADSQEDFVDFCRCAFLLFGLIIYLCGYPAVCFQWCSGYTMG
jgi:hypothetical protein